MILSKFEYDTLSSIKEHNAVREVFLLSWLQNLNSRYGDIVSINRGLYADSDVLYNVSLTREGKFMLKTYELFNNLADCYKNKTLFKITKKNKKMLDCVGFITKTTTRNYATLYLPGTVKCYNYYDTDYVYIEVTLAHSDRHVYMSLTLNIHDRDDRSINELFS